MSEDATSGQENTIPITPDALATMRETLMQKGMAFASFETKDGVEYELWRSPVDGEFVAYDYYCNFDGPQSFKGEGHTFMDTFPPKHEKLYRIYTDDDFYGGEADGFNFNTHHEIPKALRVSLFHEIKRKTKKMKERIGVLFENQMRQWNVDEQLEPGSRHEYTKKNTRLAIFDGAEIDLTREVFTDRFRMYAGPEQREMIVRCTD